MFARILLLLAPIASLGCGINNNCGPLNPFGCAKDDGADNFGTTVVVPGTTGAPTTSSSTSTSTTGETTTHGSSSTTISVDPTTAAESTTDASTAAESTETTDGTTDPTSPPVGCGNGTVEAGEQCDDGNPDAHDGCDATCIIVRRKVFVTSSVHNGDFGGLDQADGICNSLAKGKLAGTFRAWLSTDAMTNGAEHSPATRYNSTDFAGIYELVDGTIVAHGWDGLTSGSLKHAINRTEDVDEKVVTGAVWTNTTVKGESAETGHCSSWTSINNNGDKNKPITGNAGETDPKWTKDGDVQNCGLTRRLYCFQVGP